VQQAQGYSRGAVDYILSPVVPEILCAKVKVFVDLYRMRAELARSNTLLEQRVAERTADLSATNERLQREIIERQRAEQRLNLWSASCRIA
jgi:C4-dicarboxylate-specific signal transduction histidine kinase